MTATGIILLKVPVSEESSRTIAQLIIRTIQRNPPRRRLLHDIIPRDPTGGNDHVISEAEAIYVNFLKNLLFYYFFVNEA